MSIMWPDDQERFGRAIDRLRNVDEDLRAVERAKAAKPYRCLVCGLCWTKEELIDERCGDAFCGANVALSGQQTV
jgi:hypothetical protein